MTARRGSKRETQVWRSLPVAPANPTLSPRPHDPPPSTQPYAQPEAPTAAVHLIPSPRDLGAPQEWASLVA